MFAWSRTFYAKRDNMYFNFERKQDRDHAVRNYGFKAVTAKEAYANYPYFQVSWREYKMLTT